MREFYLADYDNPSLTQTLQVCSYSERSDITQPLASRDVFLFEPEGFGFSQDNEYELANSFAFKTASRDELKEIIGTLVFFPPNAYIKYNTFINAFYGKNLVLGYKPQTIWFKQRVEIIALEKGEITPAGTLECPVTFIAITPLYKENELIKTISGAVQPETVTTYDFEYSKNYPPESAGGVLQFSYSAQMDSDWQIEIDGPVAGPKITVTRQSDNSIIGQIDLSAISIEEGEKLKFNTVPSRAGAVLVSGNTMTDVTNSVGLLAGVPTFFRLPAKQDIKIAITGSTVLTDVTAKITIYEYYRSV